MFVHEVKKISKLLFQQIYFGAYPSFGFRLLNRWFNKEMFISKVIFNVMYFLQKDDIMLHFTLSGSSDITGCQWLLSYLLSYLLFCYILTYLYYFKTFEIELLNELTNIFFILTGQLFSVHHNLIIYYENCDKFWLEIPEISRT